MNPAADLPSISLFSGAGGLDLGLAAAGVHFGAWVEIDPDSRETLRSNFEIPSSRLFLDVTTVEADTLLDALRCAPGQAFVVAGGPPCQAFSTAGKRQSIADPRGALVDSYFRIVKAVQPRFFVFENVRGLLSAALAHRPLQLRSTDSDPLRPEERLGSLFTHFIRPRFQALGYEVIAGLVDAADYGVPQRRTRVLILGSRDGEFRSSEFEKFTGRPLALQDLMLASHSAPAGLDKRKRIASLPPSRNRARWVDLREALRGMRGEEPEFMPYSPARARVFDLIPQGRNWMFLRDNPGLFPPGFLEEVMGGALASSGGRVGFWRRLSWEEPSPTLTTSPVQKATALCHPDFTRPLSVQEYRRIQQFPDDFLLHGTVASKYRQLGNAVPVGLATAVGHSLIRAAQGRPWSLAEVNSHQQLPLGAYILAPVNLPV